MTGGGQPIPAGLSCPPPRFLSSDWLWILNCCLLLLQLLMDMFWIAVNYFSTINGYVSQNKDTACWYTKTHFLKFTHIQVGGNIRQLVYLTPYSKFWSRDCLYIMKWLWSITVLKMMKMSYNPDIFCLFTLISHLKYLRWWVGGNLSQLVYLAPHLDFWAVIGYGFWIAGNCCYNY